MLSFSTTGRARLGAALIGFGLTATACTSLLGDDFEVLPSAASSGTGDGGGASSAASGGAGGTASSGGGSATGGGGGTGGSAPLPLSCAWKRNEHQVILDTRDDGQTLAHAAMVEMPNGHIRMALQRRGGQGDAIEIIKICDSCGPSDRSTFFGDYSLQDMKRRQGNGTAVLLAERRQSGGSGDNFYVGVMMDVADGDASGGASGLIDVSDGSIYTEPAGGNGIELRLRFAPRGGGVVDVIGVHENSQGAHLETFFRWMGSPATPRIITPVGTSYSQSDASLESAYHFDGVTYAFLGQPGTTVGGRQLAFDDNYIGETQAGRVLGATDAIFVAWGQSGATMHTLMAKFPQNGLEVYTGQVPVAEVGSFELDDLNLADQKSAIGGLPVQDAAIGWRGDIAHFVGTSFLSPTTFGYLLYDSAGNPRGQGDLPFNAPLNGVTRSGVEWTGSLGREDFDPVFGGELEIFWIDEQNDPTSGDFSVLYTDTLQCIPFDPNE